MREREGSTKRETVKYRVNKNELSLPSLKIDKQLIIVTAVVVAAVLTDIYRKSLKVNQQAGDLMQFESCSRVANVKLLTANKCQHQQQQQQQLKGAAAAK